MTIKLASFALAALILPHQPVFAQDASQTELSNPATQNTAVSAAHEQLYDTMYASISDKAVVDGMLQSARKSYAQMPMFAEMEVQKPGFIAGFAEVMRPFLAEYSSRVRLENKPAMVAIIADALTAEEAAGLSEFYQTPLARKVLRLAGENYTADNVLKNLTDDDKPVQASQVQADIDQSTGRALGAMTDTELAQFGLAAMKYPAIMKLQTAMPRITELRARMEESPMTAGEEARMTTAIEAYMEKALN